MLLLIFALVQMCYGSDKAESLVSLVFVLMESLLIAFYRAAQQLRSWIGSVRPIVTAW